MLDDQSPSPLRPAASAASSASRTPVGPYGGSRKMTSKCVPCSRRTASASLARIIACRSSTPQRSRLSRNKPHRPRIVVDERHVRCAPAQRLDADRSRSRIGIEDLGPVHSSREDIEQRLAQTIGGWPQSLPGRRGQPAPLERSRDHAHLPDSHEAEPLLPTASHERLERSRLPHVVERGHRFAPRLFHQLMIAQQIANTQGGHA